MHMSLCIVTIPGMTWSEYVAEIAGTDQTAIARRIGHGVHQTTVGGWLHGKRPRDLYVAWFADAYGRERSEAFLAASGVPLEELRELVEWRESQRRQKERRNSVRERDTGDSV